MFVDVFLSDISVCGYFMNIFKMNASISHFQTKYCTCCLAIFTAAFQWFIFELLCAVKKIPAHPRGVNAYNNAFTTTTLFCQSNTWPQNTNFLPSKWHFSSEDFVCKYLIFSCWKYSLVSDTNHLFSLLGKVYLTTSICLWAFKHIHRNPGCCSVHHVT